MNDAEFNYISDLAVKFNSKFEWNIQPAILLAFLVCEDCNAHSICKAILDKY